MGNTVERIEIGELACWRVRTRLAEMLVAEQGAQLLGYRPHGEPPLIWLSEQAAYRKGASVRGGIPVCWPWFGALERNPEAIQALYSGQQAPAHGLVRNLDWQLQHLDHHDDSATLELHLDTTRQTLPGWPHPVELTLRLQLTDRLEVELACHNHGDTPLLLSQALHSYFAIGDIHQASIEGLDDVDYIDTLQGWRTFQQQGAVHFAGETDRIYQDSPERLVIHDPAWKRRIHLHSSGSRSTVVWNPWTDKSLRLSQFASDAWQDMLCIETANVLDDALRLQPGERKSLGLRLWSEALA